MSYFESNYSRINYPQSSSTLKGLYNAQIGATHAIGAHFTLNEDDPAIIVMPTGSGKTAVLVLSAFLLRAKRVLVISSSIAVRGQIAEEFSSLKTLKESNVFYKELKVPKVFEIKSPIKSQATWEELRKYDVVVGIPNSINTGINEAFKPNIDLFDLILVDEAHHVPAFTWTNVVNHFEKAKKVFFTATPFRRDKKEINGSLVYNYPLSRAYEDKIFGDIGYYPVVPNGDDHDTAIALETERIFKEDRSNGLNHCIMVRTELRADAQKLSELYSEKTTLKLRKVDSTISYSQIKKTIAQLKKCELDGIICVDMLGEGFDFPNLKIAAIHSPKKSLATTLQFIGRFARTNAPDIGEAKFIAVPSEIMIGNTPIYAEGSIWNDIIKDLSEGKIKEEDEMKKVIDTFEVVSDFTEGEDISFYNLNPYRHVKIYHVEDVDLGSSIKIPRLHTLYSAKSDEYNTMVFIFRETEKPKWIATDDLININHFFLLVFHDKESKLLFIHSSIKTNQFYDEIISQIAAVNAQRVSKIELNRVLADLSEREFFNIGMLNRSATSGESYRIIAGPNAEKVINKSYGRNYANGHVFLKGIDGGSNITIGYSSGSKVWSNAYDKIPIYIAWCQHIGAKIKSDKEVKTNTGFDNLVIGRVVAKFPLRVYSAGWHKDVLNETPQLNARNEDEVVWTENLLDFEITIDSERSNESTLYLRLSLEDKEIHLTYDFTEYFQYIEPGYIYEVDWDAHSMDLVEYLNDNPFHLYLEDFAFVADHEFYPPPKEGEVLFDTDRIIALDWMILNTDITKEYYQNPTVEKAINSNKNSIHESLRMAIGEDAPDVLIYDHGSGEVADFISINDSDESIEILLYHVKGSGGPNPGDRVEDVYEVCMQAVKSQVWTTSKRAFLKKISDRTKNKIEKYLIGSSEMLETILSKDKPIGYSFAIVQPGISARTLSPKVSHVLAATDDFIRNSGSSPLTVIGS